MLVQPQGKAPSTSPSRITSSPSLSSHHTPPSTPNTPPFQTTHEAYETATMPYDSPLPGGYTPGSNEGKLKHNELMELVTKLSDKVVAVEEDLKQTKKTYSTALTKLVLKEDVEIHEKNSDDTEVLLEEETLNELIEDLGSGEKVEKEISTVDVPVSTAGAEVSTASLNLSLQRNSRRVQVQMSVDEELERKIQEEEQAKEMAEQEQERINFKAALELQRQLNERE
ncbi:hypothetical protein Tco_0720979 [Tanacetum coccineum]